MEYSEFEKKYRELLRKEKGHGKFPAQPKELAVPIKHEDGLNLLHFFNFTYPFDDMFETREPIMLEDRVAYIDIITLEGQNLIAAMYETGIEIIDPSTRERMRFTNDPEDTPMRKHPNGCATLEESIISSVNGQGLLRGDLTSDLLEFLPCKGRFLGYVMNVGDSIFYLTENAVVEARDMQELYRPRTSYVLPAGNLTGFTATDSLRNCKEKDLFATNNNGTVYRWKLGKTMTEPETVTRFNTGTDGYNPQISVAYVFGAPHMMIQRRQDILLYKYLTDKDEFTQNPVEISIRGNELYSTTLFETCADMLGGLFILVHGKTEEGTWSNHLLNATQDPVSRNILTKNKNIALLGTIRDQAGCMTVFNRT